MVIKKSYKKIRILLALSVLVIAPLVAVIVSTKSAAADPLGAITRVGWGTVRAGTAEDTNGNIWSGGNRGEIKKTTKTGTTTIYTTPATTSYYLEDLTLGADGNIWFLYSNRVGSITPSGIVASFELPPGQNGVASRIAAGPDGNIWVSSWNGSATSNYIHVFSTTGAYIRYFQTGAAVSALATNYADNSIWYAQQGDDGIYPVNSNVHIFKMSTDGTKTDYPVTSGTGLVQDLAYGADGQMWFTVVNGSSSLLSKVTSSGTFTNYSISGQRLSSIAAGLDGNMWVAATSDNYINKVTPSGIITSYSTWMSIGSAPNGLSVASDGNIWFLDIAGNYVSKIGTGVTGSSVDNDGDGLTASAELTQGTSDFSSDSDKDGLSDYTESASYPGRNNLFCNSTVTTCEYPTPAQRDLYVEADWMVRPNPNGYSMHPNANQVSTIVTAYAKKGVLAHIDTGQLGGGNAVTYNSDIAFYDSPTLVDFYDYKYGNGIISTPQFNADRYHIYHYMIFGDIHDSSLHTGVSHAGDDDAFISYGLITNGVISTANNLGVSTVVMHELGHNLCLTNPADGVPNYTGQPASCRFSGIDANAGADYPSAENYYHAFDLADYSIGANGSSDHDDWGTLRFADFAASDQGEPTGSRASLRSGQAQPTKLTHEPTIDLFRKTQTKF